MPKPVDYRLWDYLMQEHRYKTRFHDTSDL